jgi:hypothetical protein
MITIQDVISTLIRSTGIALVLFWTLIASSENIWNDGFQFVFISILPIFIICAFAYTITILPFILIERGKSTKRELFKKYFPYYSIIVFIICSFYIIISDFRNIEVSFFTTAFFTSAFTWVWLFKPQKK